MFNTFKDLKSVDNDIFLSPFFMIHQSLYTPTYEQHVFFLNELFAVQIHILVEVSPQICFNILL